MTNVLRGVFSFFVFLVFLFVGVVACTRDNNVYTTRARSLTVTTTRRPEFGKIQTYSYGRIKYFSEIRILNT